MTKDQHKAMPRFSKHAADGSNRSEVHHMFLRRKDITTEDALIGYIERYCKDKGENVRYELFLLPSAAYELMTKTNSVRCLVSYQHLYKNWIDMADGLRYIAVAKIRKD